MWWKRIVYATSSCWETFDRISVEYVEVVNNYTDNAYDYGLHTLVHESLNIMGEMVGIVEHYAWECQTMKAIEIKRQPSVHDEEDSSLNLKNFHFNNN